MNASECTRRVRIVSFIHFSCLLWIPIPVALAIPNTFFGNGFIGPVIPAMPVFKADLTPDFFEVAHWEQGQFPGPWSEASSVAGQNVKRMLANPTLFGAVPMAVYAYGQGDGSPATRELAIHFLDAGLYFGYVAGGETSREERDAGQEKRNEFANYYQKLSANLRGRLSGGCGSGRTGSIGRSDELRTPFTQYQWENFAIRLVTRPNHSVSIYITKVAEAPSLYFDPTIVSLGSREKTAYFSAKVSLTETGDRVVNGLPMFQQGYTPFCGIQSLSMAGHYLGLRVHPETLAAGAEFKNTGSAKGSQILNLYRAVGQEIGMKVSTSPKFDPDRARRSIEKGVPLIVWRRVSESRERAHNEFLSAFREDPSLSIENPTDEIKQSYPPKSARGTPSHASVINGINLDRGEVIFTEPWGEAFRNRRMRIDEMEATAYAVFYFSG